jgi:hypothetical protein
MFLLKLVEIRIPGRASKESIGFLSMIVTLPLAIAPPKVKWRLSQVLWCRRLLFMVARRPVSNPGAGAHNAGESKHTSIMRSIALARFIQRGQHGRKED